MRDIIVFLQGGLGNQLFQYNFGNFFHRSLRISVSYSVSSYRSDKYGRVPLLLDLGLLKHNEIRATWNPHGIRGRCNRLLGKLYAEPGGMNNILSCNTIEAMTNSGKKYFLGYWQEYPIQKTVIDRVANVFGTVEQVNQNRVMVHARSYFASGVDNRKYRPLINYFVSAREHLERGIDALSFDVYSDSIDYAQTVADALGKNAFVPEKHIPVQLEPTDLLRKMASYTNMVLCPSTLGFWAGIIGTSRGANIVFPASPQSALSNNLPSAWKIL